MGEHIAPLETERLVLRVPTPEDAAGVYEVHRHESVAAGVVSIPHPCHESHGLEWIEKMLAAMDGNDDFIWLIEHRSDGRVIGDCGMHVNRRHHRAEIGYLLHPESWGQGFVTEALIAMLRWGFESIDPPINRFEADHYAENPASGRVCEKLGMRREGVLRQYILKNDVFRDTVRMAVLRDEFLALHGESS